MMNTKKAGTMFKLLAFSGILVVAVSSLTIAEQVDPMGYTLLIQQSPAGAGTITPGDGAHKYDIGQTVTVSALPRQGYRFLYWLGDVSATSETTTSISVDSPKMVVAVFGRSDFDDEEEILAGMGGGQGGGGGGGRLRPSPNPLTAPGGVSPASYNGGQPIYYYGGSDDSGAGDPIPEPATMALLGVGAAMLFGRQRRVR